MLSVFSPNQADSDPVHWNWLHLSGPDAKDFLHRLTTVHLKILKPGEGKSGCLLSSLGKFRSYFKLWHIDSNEYAFEFEGGKDNHAKDDLKAAIDQLTFSERMTLTDPAEQLDCRWIFADSSETLPSELTIIQEGQTVALPAEIRVSHQGKTDFGKTWLTAWGRPARLTQWIDQTFPAITHLSFAELEAWRIQAMRPRVDHEITDATLPLEVGLQDSIAAHKGCYPGQEVIERIIARGSPPRRLVLIEGKGPAPSQGTTIQNQAAEPAELGQVTSSIQLRDHYLALGLVRKMNAVAGFKVRFNQQDIQEGTISQVAPYEAQEKEI